MVAQEKRGNGKSERRRGERRAESQSEKGVVSAISSGIPYKTHGFKTIS